jgi:YegS/Rv2252/BmrU family lipid kinase
VGNQVISSAPVKVIVNPAASGGAGARVRARVEAELTHRRIPFSLVQTGAPGHAKAIAQEAMRDRCPRILVVGGDGTIHEVANGLLEGDGQPPPLGVVPVGTGNDFFRMVGSSRGVSEALDVLEEGVVQAFDVGRVRFGGDTRFFVNLLGIGVDVEVLLRRERFRRLQGLPQYLAALASALVSFRPAAYRVTYWDESGDGKRETIEDRTILTTVTVGPSVGGGFLISPEASPSDGLLDLFFVEAIGLFKIARYVPMVIRGTHENVPELRTGRLTGAAIERPDGCPFFFELDGERMPDPVRKLEIEVCPGRLLVLRPEPGS